VHAATVTALSSLALGSRLAVGLWDGALRLYDVAGGCEPICELQGHSDSVLALAAVPGGMLASGADDHRVLVHRLLRSSGSGRWADSGQVSALHCTALHCLHCTTCLHCLHCLHSRPRSTCTASRSACYIRVRRGTYL
jgi:WD40 repeat protein